MARKPFLILATCLLAGSTASAQVSSARGVEVGLGLEYLALIGNWPMDWHDGGGPVAFVRYRTASVAASLGAAATLHREEFLILDGPLAPLRDRSPGGTTNVLPRAFLELRYAPAGHPWPIIESVAARVGTFHLGSDAASWVLHRELQATARLRLGRPFELSAAVGVASVPPDGNRRPRSARTFRLTTVLPVQLRL